jgi:ribosomal protein S13
MRRTTIILDEECYSILKKIRYMNGPNLSEMVRDIIKSYAVEQDLERKFNNEISQNGQTIEPL